MSPDKQKLMEDIHSSYHRLFDLADSMELIPGVSIPMIDEAKQALIHMAGCLEDALAVSEEPKMDTIASKETRGKITSPSSTRLRQAARFLHLRVIP